MNTSRRKKNIIFITILSVLGLLGAMALQVTWIFNSYELIRNDIQKESYATIEKALEEEGNIRFGRTPKGTEILSGPTNDTIPPMAYFYQRLTEMGYPMSLHNLDSITSELLLKNELGDQYYIYIMNPRTGKSSMKSEHGKLLPSWPSSRNTFPSALIIPRLSNSSLPILTRHF